MSLQVNLRHQRGQFRLNAAFEAPAGVTALFGRSGAGKSTVLNAVAGLLRAAEGQITLGADVLQDANRFVPPHRRRIGYVFQNARLFPHMTVAQNLDYGARWASAASALSRDDVIGLLGLDRLLDRRAPGLSGGEAQRVALGRALLAQPRLLLMDEPLASLDAPRKAEILPYLEALKAEAALPILYVSHSVDEVARLADTLVLIRDGQVLRTGALDAVLSDPAAVPLIGVRDAGAVLSGHVTGQDADGLTEITVGAQVLRLPGVGAALGAPVRVRILAQDVILATARPTGLSALNVWPVTVTHVQMGDGPGAAVGLDAGGTALLARITARSARAMALQPGQPIWAVLKATSVAAMSIGRAPGLQR